MSGIVGIINRTDEGIDSGMFNRMMTSISHRGRDGRASWHEHSVGLGQQMFDTVPNSGVCECPLTIECPNELVIVADARLDNRDSLIESLDSIGTEQPSDVELICHAYSRWGVDSPEHLVGAFAFAIWDQESNRLFCARDHMGLRPLYMRISDRQVAVGSELKALLRLDGVSRRPDDQRIGHFLIGKFDVGARTFYSDLKRLQPGHRLIVTDSDIKIEQYWGPDPTRKLELGSDEAYERRFRDLFFEAVRCRLRGTGSVGSFLSGGIDSSSIVSVAGEVLSEQEAPPLHTFSAVFNDVAACDEREYINAILSTGEYEAHTIAGDKISPLSEIETQIWHQDSPFYPSLFMLIWELLRRSSNQGIDIVLSGYGGDQVLCNRIEGYPRELAQTHQLRSLYATVRAYVRRYPEITYWSLIRDELLIPPIPRRVRELRHSISSDTSYFARTPFPLNREWAMSIGILERLREDAVSPPARSHRQLHYQDLTSGEPTFNLELSSNAAAAAGVDMRFPFFDKRLVEFCLALPTDQKIRDGLGRSIARRALSRVLPEKVRTRDTKADFAPNVVHTTQQYAYSKIEEVLSRDSLSVSRYLETETLRNTCEHFENYNSWKNSRILLTATALECWLNNERTPEQDDPD